MSTSKTSSKAPSFNQKFNLSSQQAKRFTSRDRALASVIWNYHKSLDEFVSSRGGSPIGQKVNKQRVSRLMRELRAILPVYVSDMATCSPERLEPLVQHINRHISEYITLYAESNRISRSRYVDICKVYGSYFQFLKFKRPAMPILRVRSQWSQATKNYSPPVERWRPQTVESDTERIIVLLTEKKVGLLAKEQEAMRRLIKACPRPTAYMNEWVEKYPEDDKILRKFTKAAFGHPVSYNTLYKLLKGHKASLTRNQIRSHILSKVRKLNKEYAEAKGRIPRQEPSHFSHIVA